MAMVDGHPSSGADIIVAGRGESGSLLARCLDRPGRGGEVRVGREGRDAMGEPGNGGGDDY